SLEALGSTDDSGGFWQRKLREKRGRSESREHTVLVRIRLSLWLAVTASLSSALLLQEFFLSSARTSLATSLRVSKTPSPVIATASRTGSPFTFSCFWSSSTG